jgi:diguanylate cyclase
VATQVVPYQPGLTVTAPAEAPALPDALAILAMVRDAVAVINGEEASLHDSLAGSADRVERLASAGDLAQVQAVLIDEVAALRRVSLERRAAWDKTQRDLGDRVASLEAQLQHTQQEATLDPLTGIANRRAFERVCAEWLGPNRPGFVMAMVDVDNFKAINDTHGHPAGDRVLIAVASTLTRSFRAGDLIARLGGDEFVVLAEGFTLRQAETRFAAIGRAVRDACADTVSAEAAATISIGLAERSAGDTMASLQSRADAALYDAKRGGKGRVVSKESVLLRDLMKGRR